MKRSPGRFIAGLLSLSMLALVVPFPAFGAATPVSEPAAAPELIGAPPSTTISVKFRSLPFLASADTLANESGGTFIRQNPATHVVTMAVPEGMTADAFARKMSSDFRVEWAEPVKWRRLFDVPSAPLVPNDPNYGFFQQWYYDVIAAPDAWSVETGKSSVTIAVLDSGVLCSHPDLAANIWVNPGEIAANGLDDDGNGFVDDINGYDFVGAETGNFSAPDLPGDSDPCFRSGDPGLGNGLNDDGGGGSDDRVDHGTMVAGIIAAVGNNGTGVAGMCWACKVMPIRIANAEGWVRDSDSSDALTYAVNKGARIVNMSFGSSDLSTAERAAIDAAVASGVLIVAASGNANQTPISFPARLTTVMAVGASGHSNTKGRASFSNWGTGSGNNRTVDVVAPGREIFSTSVMNVASQTQNQPAGSQTYNTSDGTSFSTPLVAGLAGLILSRNPSMTADQVRTAIKNSAVPLPDDPADSPDAGPNWAGSGLINAAAALSLAGTAPTTPTPSPTASPTATPLPANAPQLTSPANGVQLSSLSTALGWTVPAGTTQYQVQVVPANNDGPAINLIRNVSTTYSIDPPVFGAGPYVMLPGMTYSWRIRATSATSGIDENSPLWGPWSAQSTFKTRTASSATISVVAPEVDSAVNTLTPILQWANSDQNVFYYEVQLSKDPNFGEQGAIASVYWELRHAGATTPPSSYAVPSAAPLEANTTYYWRVRPRIQGDGVPVAWSQRFTFRAE